MVTRVIRYDLQRSDLSVDDNWNVMDTGANLATSKQQKAMASDENCDLECAVCLQSCAYPVKLPECGHIFCFLCIKGMYTFLWALLKQERVKLNIRGPALHEKPSVVPDEIYC